MAVHKRDDPVTWGDLLRIAKRLDDRIDEAFEAIATGDETQSAFWDEHEDKIGRLGRRQNRLERRIKELE